MLAGHWQSLPELFYRLVSCGDDLEQAICDSFRGISLISGIGPELIVLDILSGDVLNVVFANFSDSFPVEGP